MIMKRFDDIIGRVRENPSPKRVAVAASQDEHTLEAVFRAKQDGLIVPLLVGNREETMAILDRMGEEIPSEDFYEEKDVQKAAARAVGLAREGKADFLMKGKLETAQLLREVVNRDTGLRTGSVMSHVSLLSVPTYHKLLSVTDGGMLLTPSLEQKKALIENIVGFLHTLGYDCPKIAVLAGAEAVNPKMQDSLDGAALKEMNQKGELTGCMVEGPISLDLSVVAEKAVIKGYESPVAGDADVLVCPDLTCGNVLGKTLVELAGATLAGLVLGAKVPIILASRGSSSEEKYLSICLAAASR